MSRFLLARVRSRVSITLVPVLLTVAALLPASSVSAAGLPLAPIPDAYVGSWWHHGANLTITRSDADPAAGSAVSQWRTYTWCQDPTTQKQNPPPCDAMVGDQILVGGLASIALQHPQGQDDRYLSGIVTATSDPTGFGKQGDSVQVTMLPGNMLMVEGTMYCGANTDYSLYPPYPCGA